jgi:hypothetical protein
MDEWREESRRVKSGEKARHGRITLRHLLGVLTIPTPSLGLQPMAAAAFHSHPRR